MPTSPAPYVAELRLRVKGMVVLAFNTTKKVTGLPAPRISVIWFSGVVECQNTSEWPLP
ncbi:hypothetical protein [Ruminococcus sp. JL13D9]|uniref:hypothetical protein n=1 Tax=Ruminococcus sp. JL13D9 TaxID=3233381 RepID=UPI00389B0B50